MVLIIERENECLRYETGCSKVNEFLVVLPCVYKYTLDIGQSNNRMYVTCRQVTYILLYAYSHGTCIFR